MSWFIVTLSAFISMFVSQADVVFAQGTANRYDCQKGITDVFTNPANTLQLGMFTCPEAPTPTRLPTLIPTTTPTPTLIPLFPTLTPGGPTITGTIFNTPMPLPTGSYTPVPTLPGPGPDVSGLQYCVDEEPGTVHIEHCDDSTRCDIAHGYGGPSAACGSVIGWEHMIIEFLLGSPTTQYNLRLSTDFTTVIQSQCYTAAAYSPYISTFNVIDSYNLAGFGEFSRGPHADAIDLLNAWRTTPGYTTGTTVAGLTPGDVVLFTNPPHAGIVNTVELDSYGYGDIWFLHTGGAYHLGKLMVTNYEVVASSTGDNSVTFGSNQSKGPDATTGETVCYCSSVCYRYVFSN